MRAHTLGALAVGLFLFTPISSAQTPTIPPGASQPGPQMPRPQMPPRDGAAAGTPTGTARITGRVVAADSGTPLRRAQIRLMAPDVRVSRMMSTDADGRYEAANLPAGRYTLTVMRNGYVSLQFGQQRPFEPGRPLELTNGQVLERVDFALPRGSVISGRITDELGEPVVGVRMQAMRYRFLPGGERQLVPANMGGMFNMVTNDLGEFRVFGLMPGTYVLSANPDDGGLMGIAGGVMPMDPSAAGDNDGYATTFYPGTLSAEQAEPIVVGVADVASVSFALSTARLTRVSGVVRNSQGRPLAGGRVMIRSRTRMGGFVRSIPPLGVDGQFTIANVPPGDYAIEIVPMPAGAQPELDEVASVPFTAAGRDIPDLVITTSPGATITGRVIFDGTSASPKPQRITAQPSEPGMGMMMRSGDNGLITADGRFELRGVVGDVLFRSLAQAAPGSVGPPTSWGIKTVTLNGNDITDVPLDVATVKDAIIEVTLTDTLSVLSGTVTNANREPVKDYVVVVLPDRLREGARPERFTRVSRPSQEGRYLIRGLPAGDYLAVAVPALEDGNEWNPAFRKGIESTATRFRLTHGQTTTLDLELKP